ncbi:MAG: hypothetical protein KKB51_18220 [Candidatus Riflebacteria bacterium]|nr:hypothetical protein [Candidatus Riflebacteria bacterium]
MKTFFKLILLMLGFPPAATEEQKVEKLITMREARDCHNAMVATLLEITYKAAAWALFHWNLPWFFESPLISNPMNVKRAIGSLGWTVRELEDFRELQEGKMVPGKVGILVHCPDSEIKGTLMQHWVVWMGKDSKGNHLLHWGQKQELEVKTEEEMFALYRTGTPNCAFEVSKK